MPLGVQLDLQKAAVANTIRRRLLAGRDLRPAPAADPLRQGWLEAFQLPERGLLALLPQIHFARVVKFVLCCRLSVPVCVTPRHSSVAELMHEERESADYFELLTRGHRAPLS
jgi:hypothetical protein